MSEAQAVQPLKPQTLQLNNVVVSGKVIDVRRTDNGTFTTVIIAAKDEYSHPATVEIMSSALVGRKDEPVRVLCELGGYRRKFQKKDGSAGWETTNYLRAVES